MTAPIDLHYWPTPNGWKISIMIEECGLPYNVKYVDILAGDQFKPEFLAISPNNRMPAIVDPQGPDDQPISIFESGAILQYLGNKSGKFYPVEPRARIATDQWLFWQMANLGPMSGQAGHFRNYARVTLPYAIERYTNEVARLYGVMNKQLSSNPFLAGEYSIADIAAFPWTLGWERLGQNREAFPHLKRWMEKIRARPAVARGLALGEELRASPDRLKTDDRAHEILFGKRA
jgi:GST-like protein